MLDLADYLSEHDPNFRKARLPALYADFRQQRNLNPDGYHANVVAWQDALSCLAYHGLLSKAGSQSSVLVLSVDESLSRQLESKQYGQPLALGTSIRDSISRQKLVPIDDFMRSNASSYSSTFSSLTWKAAGWAFGRLGGMNWEHEDTLPTGRYVLTGNVQAACQAFRKFAADMISRFDRVFTKLQFQVLFASELVPGSLLGEEDIEVLLLSLARDRVIEYDGAVVRVRGSSDESGISQEDIAAASIKELIANIKHQTEALNERIEQLQTDARAAVRRGNRISALASLKSKRVAEMYLSQRYSILSQLDDVAAKLEQASDQVQLVSVLDSSASALKALNSRMPNRSKVEDFMDQIREQMKETDEVAAILGETTIGPVDDSELDDELAALSQEAQERTASHDLDVQKKLQKAAIREQEAHLKLGQLPQPPSETSQSWKESNSPTVEGQVAQLSLD